MADLTITLSIEEFMTIMTALEFTANKYKEAGNENPGVSENALPFEDVRDSLRRYYPDLGELKSAGSA